MRDLLIAALAFAGASMAQLLTHFLSMRRKERDDYQKAIQFTYALIAEIDHASKILSIVISLLSKSDKDRIEYVFEGDPITIQFAPKLLEKYDYSLLIYPQTIYRAASFIESVKPLIERLDRGGPTFTEAGHRYLVGLLRYGLTLSVRLKTSTETNSIEEGLPIDDEVILQYFSQFRFPGGGTHLSAAELRDLLKMYPQVRF